MVAVTGKFVVGGIVSVLALLLLIFVLRPGSIGESEFCKQQRKECEDLCQGGTMKFKCKGTAVACSCQSSSP